MHVPVDIALLAWPFLAQFFFPFMHPRRAILATLIIGWLFLPMAEINLQGYPRYDKLMAVNLGAFLGSLIFDMKTWTSFRPKWYDSLPFVYTLSALISSLSNDLGVYDAVSAAFRAFTSIGMTYFLGRHICQGR